MKNILLPTDLTIQSLLPIHDIAKAGNGEECTIKLVHMLEYPTSITDLLYIDSANNFKRTPAEFLEAIQLLINKYRQTNITIQLQFVYCGSRRFLNNFIEGNEIHQLCLLDNYSYVLPFRDSAKFIDFVHKVKIPIRKITVKPNHTNGFENVSMLLQGNNKRSGSIEKKAVLSMQ